MKYIYYTIIFVLLSFQATSQNAQSISSILKCNQQHLDSLSQNLVFGNNSVGSGSIDRLDIISHIGCLQIINALQPLPGIASDAASYDAIIGVIQRYADKVLKTEINGKVALHNRDSRTLGEKILEAGRIRARIEQTLELLNAPGQALKTSFDDTTRNHLGYVQKVIKATSKNVDTLKIVGRLIKREVKHIRQDVTNIRYSADAIRINTHYTNILLGRISDELIRQESWRWNISAFAGRGDYWGGNFAFRADKLNKKSLTFSFVLAGTKNDGFLGGINAGGFFMKNFHFEAGPVLRTSDNALMGNARLSLLLPSGGKALLTPYTCYLSGYGFGVGLGVGFGK